MSIRINSLSARLLILVGVVILLAIALLSWFSYSLTKEALVAAGKSPAGILGQIATAGGLVFAGGLFLALVLIRKTMSGLNTLVAASRELSSGNLSVSVPEGGVEEVAEVSKAVNGLAGNLRSLLSQILGAQSALDMFVDNVLVAINEQAQTASQEAASVAEVTATAEELTRTSRQIAENAESVKEAASQTMEMAQQGNVLLREAVTTMDQLRDRVGDIAQRNQFLREKSNEIGKVLEIIKEIADEIHLLALNAAIESAAAGEHGKRFSVVASEVRRLADKTRESTDTIRSVIGEIQGATMVSVRATEEGARDADRGRETVKLSSSAFEEISEMIEKTSSSSIQISLATHQQTSANEQVVQVMRQVADAIRQSATKVHDAAELAAELKVLTRKLRDNASAFRV